LPAVRTFQRVAIVTINAGVTGSTQWTADDTYTIHSIIINEKTGADLKKVYLTFRIKDDVVTRDKAPCTLFQAGSANEYAIDRPVSKGTVVDISVENATSSQIDVEVILVLT
jgi:hypothetical protein